jgi:hypothetical protein
VSTPEGLADGTRVRIVRGSPSDQEAVAVLLALDAARRAGDGAAARRPARPGWRRAARLEGVGGPRVLAARDLDV